MASSVEGRDGAYSWSLDDEACASGGCVDAYVVFEWAAWSVDDSVLCALAVSVDDAGAGGRFVEGG